MDEYIITGNYATPANLLDDSYGFLSGMGMAGVAAPLSLGQYVMVYTEGLSSDEFAFIKKNPKRWAPHDKKSWCSIKEWPQILAGQGKYKGLTKKDLFIFFVLLSLVKDNDARILVTRQVILDACNDIAPTSSSALSIAFSHLKAAELLKKNKDGILYLNADIAGRGTFAQLHYLGYLEPNTDK